jgi:predicted DNA binding CopG/RHH family protein
MLKLKKPLPKFNTDEEEAEFWDNHSSLEYFDELDLEPLRVKVTKNRMIVTRLDSKSREQLDRLASEAGVGPSTFVRHLIMEYLRQHIPIRIDRKDKC